MQNAAHTRENSFGRSAYLPAPHTFNRERREAHRSLLGLPAWVIFYRNSREKRMIKIRNMTRQGIFFYSDLAFRPGQIVEFVLRLPRWTRSAPIACRGVVTRVEIPAAGPQGAAVLLDRCFVLK